MPQFGYFVVVPWGLELLAAHDIQLACGGADAVVFPQRPERRTGPAFGSVCRPDGDAIKVQQACASPAKDATAVPDEKDDESTTSSESPPALKKRKKEPVAEFTTFLEALDVSCGDSKYASLAACLPRVKGVLPFFTPKLLTKEQHHRILQLRVVEKLCALYASSIEMVSLDNVRPWVTQHDTLGRRETAGEDTTMEDRPQDWYENGNRDFSTLMNHVRDELRLLDRFTSPLPIPDELEGVSRFDVAQMNGKTAKFTEENSARSTKELMSKINATEKDTVANRDNDADDDPRKPEPIAFRVTTVRLEKKGVSFSSMDLSRIIGDQIGALHASECNISMHFHNTEFFVLHQTPGMYLGLMLHPQNLPRLVESTTADVSLIQQLALEKQRREIGRFLSEGRIQLADVRNTFGNASHFRNDVRPRRGQNAMHVSLAHALCRVAQIQPYEVLVDPMGGSGSVIVEALLKASSALEESKRCHQLPGLCLSGDRSGADAKNQFANFRSSVVSEAAFAFRFNDGTRSGTRFPTERTGPMHWDATRLPIRTGSVDVVVTDMPFGRRCGTHSVNNKLYPVFLKSCHRVLRADGKGRAILLTVERQLMQACLEAEDQRNLWRLGGDPFQMDMGGLQPFVFVLWRKP